MEIMNASEVKQAFGEALMKSQKAPVKIHKNGKPVAVMVSAEEYEKMKLQLLRAEIDKGLSSAEANNLIDGKDAINGFKERIKDAKL